MVGFDITRIRSKHLFVAVLIAAAVLRFLFLTEHSLWVDELFSLRFAHLHLSELLPELVANDNHPPLYYALLHFWIQAFGDSEFAIRSLSVLFGVLMVVFVYKLGALLYDKQTGLLAALVISIAKFSIYYSQEARMYSLLPFLATVSIYYFWNLIHNPTVKNVVSYIASTILLLYTHSYGIFIVIAQNSYLLMLWLLDAHRAFELKPIRWAALQLVVLVAFMPWAAVLAQRVARLHTEGYWVSRPTMMTVAGTFSAFSGSGPVLRILLVLLVILSAVSPMIIIARAHDRGDRRTVLQSADFKATSLLFFCLLMPVVLPLLISQFSTPIYLDRATGVGYSAFCLLVARGLTSIKMRSLFFAAVATIVALSLSILAVTGYVHRDEGKYRELAEYVAANAPRSAFIVTCDDGQMSWPFAYYSRALGLLDRLTDLNDRQIKDASWQVAKNHPVVWLITSERRREAMDRCRKLPGLLQQSYRSMIKLVVPIQGFGIRVYSDPV